MNLQEFFTQAMTEMIRANQDRRHPFRTMVLATKSDYPGLRTVVKRRSLEDHSMLVYTDSRTDKVNELQTDPRGSLLVYDPEKKLQVIFYVTTELITAGPLFMEHQKLALHHPKDYSTQAAPGTEIGEAAYGYGANAHFCLLRFVPDSIQILQLGKERHTRAIYRSTKDWKGQWLVP